MRNALTTANENYLTYVPEPLRQSVGLVGLVVGIGSAGRVASYAVRGTELEIGGGTISAGTSSAVNFASPALLNSEFTGFPPYSTAKPVVQGSMTADPGNLVRVYFDSGEGKTITSGSWFTTKETIVGLNNQEIKNVLGLEHTPNMIADVRPDVNSLQNGIPINSSFAGSQVQWGGAVGGGWQGFFRNGNEPEWFKNSQPLSTWQIQNTK